MNPLRKRIRRNWLPSEPGHFARLPALAIFREEHIWTGSLLPEQATIVQDDCTATQAAHILIEILMAVARILFEAKTCLNRACIVADFSKTLPESYDRCSRLTLSSISILPS